MRGIAWILFGIAWLEIFQPLYSQLSHPMEVVGELCALMIGFIAIAVGTTKAISAGKHNA